MKRNHSGKVRFYLNVVTGNVKFITYENGVTCEWVDVGAYYKFASLTSELDESANSWKVIRGGNVLNIVHIQPTFSPIEPDYFLKIIAARVAKKLRQ